MANQFSIKITRGSDGKEVSLENMTIEAADALTVFIESLADVAKLHKDNSDIRLSLKNGSIEAVLTYPDSETEIDSDIEDAIEGKSYNGDFIKILKTIQSKVKANGLEYSITRKGKDNAIQDLTARFKDKDFTVKTGPRKEWYEEVAFISGRLFISGGKKNANIHLDAGSLDYIVNCTEQQATRLNRLLYSTVYVCALKKWKVGAEPTYSLLDSYIDSVAFLRFKSFYESINNDSLESFDIVHDKIVESVEKNTRQGSGELVKLLRLFNHPQSDRGMLRTILATLKPIRDNELIADLCKQLADILRAGSTHKVI